MMLKRLIQLTFILIALFYAADVQAGIIIRPVHHFGLVGYWDFQEGTGTTANDHSGNSNHGTMMWMATSTPTGGWTDGRIGSGLDFDGGDDYVLGSGYSYSTFSVSAWIKTAYIENYAGIVGYTDNSGNRREIGLDTGGSPLIVYGDLKYKKISDQVDDDTWHHLVGTYDDTTAELYVDGESVSLGSETGAGVGSTDVLRIGRLTFGSYYFDGTIDEVRVYNRALSAGEVERLYKLSQPRVMAPSMTGLVGYWRFDEGTGLKAGDHSGQGNHGTLESSMTEEDWVEGKYGTALDFDGNDDYVNTGDIATFDFSDTDSTFTVSAWIKADTITQTDVIASKYNSDGVNERGWMVSLAAGDPSIALSEDGTWSDSTVVWFKASYALSTGIWYHVAYTVDVGSDIFTIYVNGNSVSANHQNSKTTIDDIFNNSENVNLGTASDGGDSPENIFDGLIDEVRIYNRALTASEVEALYKSGLATVNAPQTGKLTDGLVGMWSFDGQDIYWPANMAVDRSGQGNHGAITNMSTSTAPTTGKVGQALEFDGVDDYVNMGDITSLDGADELTVSAWIKPDTHSNDIWVSKHHSTSDGSFYVAFPSAANTIRCMIINSDSNRVDHDVTYTDSTDWQHIVCRYDGTDIRIYVDSAEVGTPSEQTGVIKNVAYDLIIGDFHQLYWTYKGLIDEVRIYNRALSADEIKRLYNMGR